MICCELFYLFLFFFVVQFLFPFHASDHYTLYVVNLEENVVQHFDNLFMKDLKYEIAVNRAKLLTSKFSEFLKKMGHSRWGHVESFAYKYVSMTFNLDDNVTNGDCGIYVMLEMKDFEGVAYDSEDLGQVLWF